MNYITFDNCHDNNGYIAEALRKEGVSIEEIYSPGSSYKWISWLKGAVMAIQRSSSGDTCVFWYDFQGVIALWMCKLFFLKRRIIILNLLLKYKPTLKNRLASCFYKSALLSDYVTTTVTSLAYGEALNRQLKITKRHELLHDIYPTVNEKESGSKASENMVFCGGSNGRDWELMMEIGQSMADVQFTLVMPASVYEYYLKRTLPGNIHILKNVSLPEFNRLLQESSIVVLPLNTNAPAGLIVVLQAASQQKLVITTSTPVTKEYIDQDSGVLCENIAEQYIKEIRFHLQHPDIAMTKGRVLHDKLKSMCSQETYIKKLCHIIHQR